jgi:hypothetical protein
VGNLKEISDFHKAAIVVSVLLAIAAFCVHNATTKRELKEASKVAGAIGVVTGSLLTLGAIL